jgi:hypothetical protein
MIITKKKPCSVEGCSQPRYARGYCPSHYRSLYLAPKMRDKPKKQYVIPKRTKKRAQQEVVYRDLRKDFIEEKRSEDKLKRIFCIFCGLVIKGEPDLHHGLGRDDDKLLRKEDWFLAHHDCHMDYHSKSWKKLIWWSGYMIRIMCNFLVRQRELRKMEK